MIKALKFTLAVIVLVTLWGTIVFVGLDRGWGYKRLAPEHDIAGFMDAARSHAEANLNGNLGLILIEDGKEAGSFFLSKGDKVDRDSVFQVASLSKWLAAWGVLVLVDEGRIDLDAPVSNYLTRWNLPESDYDAEQVTVRRLLSHTGGLTDGLGYDGFSHASGRQSLEGSLTHAADASPGKDGRVVLGAEPGSGFNYSGGGYTLLQLVIEEVSGQSFAGFMTERVFEPMGMDRTTFDHSQALKWDLAQNFRESGETEPFRWYSALAATSLFTSAGDMARFLEAQAPTGSQSVLKSGTMTTMYKPHASNFGADIWGLGAMLFAPNSSGGHIVGHDGKNAPAINSSARFNPATGDGIVVLSTGSSLLATHLGGEWVFWRTGRVDALTFVQRLPRAFTVFGVGAVLILLASILVFLLQRRRTKL